MTSALTERLTALRANRSTAPTAQQTASQSGSRPALAPGGASKAAIWTALAIVYVVWGSTYLAIRVVVREMPPFTAAGLRFLTAGLLVAAYVTVRHGPGRMRVKPRELGSAALVGLLLLLGGNGLVSLGERTVPSGLAALLVAATPLSIVILRRLSGDRPRAMTWAGVLVGFAGLGVLVGPGASGGSLAGVLMIVAATLSWAIGSFASPKLPMPSHPAVATSWEMLAGGGAMMIVGLTRGEHFDYSFGYSGNVVFSLAYLVVFGSIVAFSAYVWLLSKAPISLVATYAYVNPVVAVILGALMLSEPVTAAIFIGGAIVVVGVALVVGAERPRPIADEGDPPTA
jgi:drug/metabolite transporter (DMT)-like permease